jgi:GTP-binding protein
MEIKKADLLGITSKKEQYPLPGPPEIAFAGRSNVGKSSLLNLLTARKKLAYVSGSPGKTQTINFYSINDDLFRIVDLPGYGYARVPKSVSEKWGRMVETYLEGRETLKKVAILVDIRHEPTAQDAQLYAYLKHFALSGLIIATKADKIGRSAIPKQLKQIRSKLAAVDSDEIICVSALKKTGVTELLKVMEGIVGNA